jgi:hypothetical protein
MSSITTVNKTGFVINVTTTSADINSSIRNCLNPGEFYVHSAAPGIRYTLNARYFTGSKSIYESNWEKLAEIIGHVVLNLANFGLVIISGGASAPAWAASASSWATGIGLSGTAARLAQITVQETILAVKKEIKKEVEDEIKELILEGHSDKTLETSYSTVDGAGNPVFEIVCKDGRGQIERTDTASSTATAKLMDISFSSLDRDSFEQQRRTNEIYEFSAQGYQITYNLATKRYEFVDSTGRTVILEEDHAAYFLDSNGNRVDYTIQEDWFPCPYSKQIAKDLIEWPGWTIESSDTDRNRDVWAVKGEYFDGMEIIVEPGYGVINARMIFDENCVTPWVRDELGSNDAYRRQFTFSGSLTGITVAQKDGYGIVDLKLHYYDCAKGQQVQTSPWLDGNPEVVNATNIFDRKQALWAGSNNFSRNSEWVVVGMKSIGNHNYGLVDMGLAYMRRSDLIKEIKVAEREESAVAV